MRKSKMEELLNKLIKKGWKPFGDNAIKLDYDGMKTRYGYGAITYKYRDSYIDDYGDEVEYEEWKHQFNNRELVSKESGLWQFVSKNEMIKLKFGDRRHYNTDNYRDKICLDCNYPYWLMEASLKDESELESFLLNNIVIKDE